MKSESRGLLTKFFAASDRFLRDRTLARKAVEGGRLPNSHYYLELARIVGSSLHIPEERYLETSCLVTAEYLAHLLGAREWVYSDVLPPEAVFFQVFLSTTCPWECTDHVLTAVVDAERPDSWYIYQSYSDRHYTVRTRIEASQERLVERLRTREGWNEIVGADEGPAELRLGFKYPRGTEAACLPYS